MELITGHLNVRLVTKWLVPPLITCLIEMRESLVKPPLSPAYNF